MRHRIVLSTALLLTAPASGHHSDAGLDMESVVSFEGTVTEFSWRNPHVYVAVEATDERGDPIEWTLQMGSTITVTRMGWTRDSLSTGDRVRVGTHAARNGRPYGLLNSIEKVGGIVLPTSFDSRTGDPLLASPEVTASTSTLEGKWMADPSSFVSYPGGIDGYFRAQLSLTEKGEAAEAVYDPLSADNPGSSCIGMPTPILIIFSTVYPLEIRINEDEDTIVIRTEFFDDERTVYMDGRGHPEGGERLLEGHSIGWWEEDTLVVDTRNFADHRSPYQTGVPSGAQKHVVERYRLAEDGTRLVVEFMLDDPEYITEPITHTRELIYSPQMETTPFDCDPEAAKRFVPQ